MTAPVTPARPRRTGRTVALIVAGVLVVVVMSWFAVGAARSLTSRPNASGTYEVERDFESVKVDSELADVTVAYGDVDRAEITLQQDESRDRLELDHEVRNGTLLVELRRVSEPGWPRLWWPWSGSNRAHLELTLPAALERDPIAIDLTTNVGDIFASGTFTALSARSQAGEIELRGSAASVDARTDLGDVDLVRLTTVGDVDVRTSAGDVTLEFEELPSGIRVDTELGRIEARLPDGDYALSTDTSLGDVELSAPHNPASDRRYAFSTSVGDITIRN